MRVESRVFPPFIAKRVKEIFGYYILLYGFLFRRQWRSFSRSFAWIGLLFIKWRRVEHKAARARTFLVQLARLIPWAAVYKLRFTLEKRKEYILRFHKTFCHKNFMDCEKNSHVWTILILGHVGPANFKLVFLTWKSKRVSPQTFVRQVYWKWSYKFLKHEQRICVHASPCYGLKRTELRSFCLCSQYPTTK